MILKRLLKYIDHFRDKDQLKIKGRKTLSTADFYNNDNLYRGFKKNDLNDEGKLEINTIRFPDFSCNWSRFSKPHHIKYRENGNKKDGCYSITVKASRYKSIATPVHDPVYKPIENYSHVEVRLLYVNEDILFAPPKGRKQKSSRTQKSLRAEYRQNIINNLVIKIQPK